MKTDLPTSHLLRALNPVVRASVARRFDAMVREYEFLREKQDDRLAFVRSKGWTEQKLLVLFSLNCVYQLCIGPLHSSARVSVGLGGDIPIKHGADIYGWGRAKSVNEMATDFESLSAKLGFEASWLQKNTCGDLLYWIARREQELAAFEGGA